MKFLLLTALLFSSSAFALTKSLYTLTPGSSQTDLQVGAGYATGKVTTNTTPSIDVDISGYEIPLSAYYGLDENNAIGAELTYESIDSSSTFLGTTTKSHTKGFDGLLLGYKGNFDLGMATLYVAAGVQVPLEKGKKKQDDPNTETDTLTNGQIGLPITVGIVVPVQQIKFGGLAKYTFMNTGSAEADDDLGNSVSVDTKDGGGYQFAAFMELPRAYNLNISIQYQRQYATHYTVNGFTGTWNTSAENAGLMVQMLFPITPNFQLIPVVKYQTLLHPGDYNISKYDLYEVGAIARFLF